MSEIDNFNFEVKTRIMGEDPSYRNAKVKVFGVGGAGGNTVNRMKQMSIDGVEYYAINTDAMALDLSLADHKILIGEKSTRNLGAGMDPDAGRKAVEENIDDIKEAMKGADMVFVTAGMGGGTGTGAAPIVASIARELGILTVAVVTKPFRWEGNARSSLAMKGIENLRSASDTIIVVENKKLLTLLQNSNQKATMEEAFKIADEILGNAVQSICGIMFRHGLVHVDFADIRKVMLKGGSALMGTGYAQGENRGIIAADMALASPLLEDINIEGASGVLVNVAHGENYSLLEHSDAMEHIYEKVGEEGDPNIIIGDITDPALGDKVCITIIATGCGGTANAAPKAPAFTAQNIMRSIPQSVMPMSAMQMPSAASAAPAAPAPQPTVQPATPRPTGFNVFEFNKPAEPVTSSIPSVTETQVMASVQSAMFGSPAFASKAFSDPAFDAKAPAEEVAVRGSETSEFSAVAEEDRLNGGRGGVETTSNNAGFNFEQPAYNAGMQGVYGTPAFVRNQEQVAVAEPAMSGVAVASEVAEETLKDRSVDYSLPAYLRNNDMNNF